MNKNLHIVLNQHDLGQLLDGLRIRAEAWGKTADYLESGFNADDYFIIEECSDPHEARGTAQHYEKIATDIETQVAKQGGWQ